jgi:hypothetical protein
MLCDASHRFQPLLDAIESEAQHDCCNEVPARGSQVDRLRGPGRFLPDSRQGVLAAAIVGQASSRLEDGTVDFAETGALIDDTGLSGGREHERWGIRRIRDEWSSAASEHRAHRGGEQKR